MARRRRSKKSKERALKKARLFNEFTSPQTKPQPAARKVLRKPLTVRVLSIDPGMNMGITMSVLDYNALVQQILFCGSFKIENEKRGYEETNIGLASNALVNTVTIRNLIATMLKEYQPDVVICEAAFLGRFPQAFASLSLCLNAIETAVYEYDYDVGFYTFDPPTVKMAMGVKGNSKDKDEMHHALLSNAYIKTEQDLTLLDEHAVDSACIGHCYFRLTAEF